MGLFFFLKKKKSKIRDELRTTIALKKQLLAYETQLQELQKEVVILRELTGTEQVESGSEEDGEERDADDDQE